MSKIEQLLVEKMLIEANIIKSTVDYIQVNIEKRLLLLDELKGWEYSEEKGFLKIKKEILDLLLKLKREEAEMDTFISKYKGVNEKKDMSFVSGKKGQIHLRGVSTDCSRKKGGKALQEKVM